MLALFYLFAALAVGSAAMVITRRNAVHSALWLIVTFFAVAGLFILQRAEFLAAVQVLVYAGGIMVLFLFVIMLVNLEQTSGQFRSPLRLATAATVTALTVGGVAAVLAGAGPLSGVAFAEGPPISPMVREGMLAGNLEAVGMQLLTTYLLPFELVSLVLMVAVIGAIVLARRDA
jgi:NADH-quinone oxidoreductase subunit J